MATAVKSFRTHYRVEPCTNVLGGERRSQQHHGEERDGDASGHGVQVGKVVFVCARRLPCDTARARTVYRQKRYVRRASSRMTVPVHHLPQPCP